MRKVLLATLLVASSAALAQPVGPGPGMGPGAGKGPGARWGADVTPGWAMMSAEERKAHQEKMAGFKDPAECNAYMAEHHKTMESRAKQQGKALPGRYPGRACDFVKK